MINKIWCLSLLLGVLLCCLQDKMEIMSKELLNGTKEAVDLFIVMSGAVAMWSGFMKVAEESGLVDKLSGCMKGVLKVLFPSVPSNHPAMKYISINIAANMLGLGWAATPSGILAVKHLDTLSRQKGKATNDMCMFLVINMSSVQLISINIISCRMKYASADAAEIVLPGIIATAVSTVVSVAACKWCERRSDETYIAS
ncbi:MAG: nucleoside recognition protein [Firmicutes bacterium]|nr:nucleoside recognition protein [Bacillota bacterium]